MTQPGARPPAEPDAERHLACIELVELVTAYVEGDLSPAENAHVDRHLEACPGCAAYVDQMRQTIAIAGRLSPDEVPHEAIDPLLAIFRASRAGGRRADGS